MTYKELCDEVAALGFESQVENDAAMLSAAKRAVKILFTERPSYKTLELYQQLTEPSVYLESFTHDLTGGDKILFNALAYSFKTVGEGICKITDESGEHQFEFTKEENIHRGFLHGAGEIEFLGNYAYTVYDFALFDKLYGKNASDIPIVSGDKEYDIRLYTDDFLSFVQSPADADGAPIKNAALRGAKIIIPYSYCGKIRLVYKCCPTSIDKNPDAELILPDGCEHLLPLLVASYVWLDDDAEKSQYYMALYREAISSVKYYDRTQINTAYRDTNGWA